MGWERGGGDVCVCVCVGGGGGIYILICFMCVYVRPKLFLTWF